MTTTRGLRLTVYLEESRQAGHRPLYAEIVRRAHAAGLAGASVFRGFEGYGSSSQIHTSRVLSLSDDLPVAVVVVDDESAIRAFLSDLADLVPRGTAVVEEVEIVRFGPAGT